MIKHLTALAAVAIMLQGCATQPPAAQVGTRNYDEGIAKSCAATPIDLAASATATSTVTMTNDGWCAVRAVEKDGKPFALGLLRARPAHGIVLIRSLGGQTRLEYTPETRFVGTDRFTAVLRSKTANVPDATVQVVVNVTMGEGMALPPAPPAPVPPQRGGASRARTR